MKTIFASKQKIAFKEFESLRFEISRLKIYCLGAT